jgi:hypothetical protein
LVGRPWEVDEPGFRNGFWNETGCPPREVDADLDAHHLAHHSGVTGWMSR